MNVHDKKGVHNDSSVATSCTVLQNNDCKTWVLVQSVSQYTQLLTVKVNVKMVPHLCRVIQNFHMPASQVEFFIILS